jgi:hypothetical protein
MKAIKADDVLDAVKRLLIRKDALLEIESVQIH